MPSLQMPCGSWAHLPIQKSGPVASAGGPMSGYSLRQDKVDAELSKQVAAETDTVTLG